MPGVAKLLVPGTLLFVFFQTFSVSSNQLTSFLPDRTLQGDKNNKAQSAQPVQQPAIPRYLEVVSTNFDEDEDDDDEVSVDTSVPPVTTTTTTLRAKPKKKQQQSKKSQQQSKQEDKQEEELPKQQPKEELPEAPKPAPTIDTTSWGVCTSTCKELFAIDLGFDQDTALDTNSKEDFLGPWKSCRCGRFFCTKPDDLPEGDQRDLAKKQKNPFDLKTCVWNHHAITLLVDLVSASQTMCTAPEVQKYFLSEEWERYNFGDMFFGRGVWAGENYHKQPKKSGSLMEAHYEANMEHIKKTGKKKGKKKYQVLYGVMKQTVEAMADDNLRFDLNIDLPPPKTLVVHLRLGDVIDSAVENVQELLEEQQYYFRRKDNKQGSCCDDPWVKPKHLPYRQAWNAYVKPLSYFTQQIQQLAQDNNKNNNNNHEFTHIVIMGAAHKGQDLPADFQTADRSCLYTNALHHYFQKAFPKATVTQRLGQPPDSDVLYASLSDGFIQSGGGYSQLLASFQQMMKPVATSQEFQQTRAKFKKRQHAIQSSLQGQRFSFSKLSAKDTALPWVVKKDNSKKSSKQEEATTTTTDAPQQQRNRRTKRIVQNKPPKKVRPVQNTGPLVASSVRANGIGSKPQAK